MLLLLLLLVLVAIVLCSIYHATSTQTQFILLLFFFVACFSVCNCWLLDGIITLSSGHLPAIWSDKELRYHTTTHTHFIPFDFAGILPYSTAHLNNSRNVSDFNWAIEHRKMCVQNIYVYAMGIGMITKLNKYILYRICIQYTQHFTLNLSERQYT